MICLHGLTVTASTLPARNLGFSPISCHTSEKWQSSGYPSKCLVLCCQCKDSLAWCLHSDWLKRHAWSVTCIDLSDSTGTCLSIPSQRNTSPVADSLCYYRKGKNHQHNFNMILLIYYLKALWHKVQVKISQYDTTYKQDNCLCYAAEPNSTNKRQLMH